MKKFSMLALIAFSWAACTSVNADDSNTPGNFLPPYGTGNFFFLANILYDSLQKAIEAKANGVPAAAGILEKSNKLRSLLNSGISNPSGVDRKLAISYAEPLFAYLNSFASENNLEIQAELNAVRNLYERINPNPTAPEPKPTPTSAPEPTPQGRTQVQNAKAIAKGFTGKTNTVSTNQLKAIKTAFHPTANTVAQSIVNSKMPITASGFINAKTKAEGGSKIDGSAFAMGAQFQNDVTSNVSGSSNDQGAATAASINSSTANYSGANLVNIAKALAGTPAKGKAQRGLAAQGISGAMNVMDTNTSNKGGLLIKGGADAAKSVQHGLGGLGNVISKTNLSTTGAQNFTGATSGSINTTSFVGNADNKNT